LLYIKCMPQTLPQKLRIKKHMTLVTRHTSDNFTGQLLPLPKGVEIYETTKNLIKFTALLPTKNNWIKKWIMCPACFRCLTRVLFPVLILRISIQPSCCYRPTTYSFLRQSRRRYRWPPCRHGHNLGDKHYRAFPYQQQARQIKLMYLNDDPNSWRHRFHTLVV